MADDSNQTIPQGSDPGSVAQMAVADPQQVVPDDGASGVQSAVSPAPVAAGAAAPSQTPAPAPSGGDPQKNPLDVLEQLLSEIDGGKPGSSPTSPEKKGPTPEEIAAAELEKRRIEFEEKQAAQKIIDQQKIEEQRQILNQEMSTGTANIARSQQDEEKKAQEEEKKSAEEGFEIIQINHTKI